MIYKVQYRLDYNDFLSSDWRTYQTVYQDFEKAKRIFHSLCSTHSTTSFRILNEAQDVLMHISQLIFEIET